MTSIPGSPRKLSISSEMMEPKRKPKGKPRRSKTPDFLCLNEDEFSDVTIKAGDRSIFSNNCLLSYNSSKFKEMLSVDSSGKGKGKTPASKTLDLSDNSFIDVCNVVSFIDPRVESTLEEDDAINLMPIAYAYDITQLRKACGSAITQSFEKKRKSRKSGSIPTEETMKYLLLADKYEIKDLQTMCTAEMVANDNPHTNKALSEQAELSERAKRMVLEEKLEKANKLLAKARRLQSDVAGSSDMKGKANTLWNKM